MKYTITALLLGFSAMTVAEEQVDQTLTVNPNGEVHIKMVDGDIDIQSWDKSEVRIVGTFDEDEARLDFKTSGNKTLIEIEPEGSGWGRHSGESDVELTVYVPSGSSLEAGGVSTDFSIQGVQGGVDIQTVSGDLVADALTNDISLDSVSGDIVVSNSTGKMNIGSVSGDIEVQGDASHYEASTVSGDIESRIGTAERVSMRTVSGDIDLDFTFSENGRLDSESVSGDIEIEFNNSVVNARFELETGPGGDIDNDITDDKVDITFIHASHADFKSGNGKGSVNINTMSGTIKVKK